MYLVGERRRCEDVEQSSSGKHPNEGEKKTCRNLSYSDRDWYFNFPNMINECFSILFVNLLSKFCGNKFVEK